MVSFDFDQAHENGTDGTGALENRLKTLEHGDPYIIILIDR